VGAGDGRLSHFLNVAGLNIKPTDNYSWGKKDHPINYPQEVEKIDFRKALKKYNPDLVIICWEELGAPFTQEILKHPSVKGVIWIGEGEGGCTGAETTFDLPHKMLNSSKYALARTDMSWDSHLHRHTAVYLFHKRK